MPKKEELKQDVSVEDIKLDARDDLKGEETKKEVEKLELPEEFKDSKPEDLVKKIEEQREALAKKDDQIGSIGERFAEFEKRQGYLEGLATQLTTAREKPKEKQKIEFDIENPIASVQKVVDERIGARSVEDQNVAYQKEFMQSKAAYNEGYQVMAGNPMYEGIEEEVSNKMGIFYSQFIGDPRVSVEAELRNPKNWERVAQNIRHDRGEHDKTDPGHIEPVHVSGGARPAESRRDRDEFDASIDTEDPETLAWMKENKLTIEDAQKIITDEAEETLRGGS